MAGKVSGLGWFRWNAGRWKGRKLAVFCVGASPSDAPNVRGILAGMRQSVGEDVGIFCCPGGFNRDKATGLGKMAMNLLARALGSKKNRTPQEEGLARLASGSYDIADKRHLDPIGTHLRDRS